MPSHRAVVVSLGAPRNTTLVASLQSAGFAVDILGVPPEEAEEQGFIKDSPLSVPEIACKMAHARAYALGGSDPWLLVCEDDADVDVATLAGMLGLLDSFDPSTPTIVSLYLGPWSIVRNPDSVSPLLECLMPPDGSLCYFINHAARQLAAGRWDIARPADWPLWGRSCRFYVVPGIAVPLADVPSHIGPAGDRRLRARDSSREARRRIKELSGLILLDPSMRGSAGMRDWWFWEIRQRLVWHMPALFGGRRSASLLRHRRGSLN